MKCIYCEGACEAHWPKPEKFVKCQTCGLVFRNPFPDEAQLKLLYEKSWLNPLSSAGETGGADSILASQYAREIGKTQGVDGILNKKILDYGAGRGHLLEALLNSGADAYGYEPYGHELSNIPPKRYFQNLSEIPSDEKFDGIISMDVFEHLLNPWKMLAEVRPILKQGGWIIISTPNPSGINARLSKSNWREAKKAGHILFANPDTICRMVESEGYSRSKSIRWKIGEHQKFNQHVLHNVLSRFGLYGASRVIAFNDAG